MALALPARNVQIVDRCWSYANKLPELPQHPARAIAVGFIGEHCLPDKRVHMRRFERGGIVHMHMSALDSDSTTEER